MILRNVRNSSLQVVDLRSITFWKQVLQLEPHFPCCFTVHDTARDINVHWIDQPWQNHGVTTLPILIQRWINIWSWEFSIDKANLFLGSESKHHCSGPRMIVPHSKQWLSNKNISWILIRTEKIGIRNIGFAIRVCISMCGLCVGSRIVRIKETISLCGRRWKTLKMKERNRRKILEERKINALIPCKKLSLNRNWFSLIENDYNENWKTNSLYLSFYIQSCTKKTK